MKKHDLTNSDSAILRQKAEKLLKTKEKGSLHSESDALKMMHELQVYQIELEMQNEELALAKQKAIDLAAERYAELYDFAPTGYFTLSKSGKIIKLNLSGAAMLSKERNRLTGKMLSFYVSDDTKPVFNRFLNNVFKIRDKQSCEVTFQLKGKEPIYVHMQGIVSGKDDKCFVTASDISNRIHTEELLKQKDAVLTRQNELFSQLLKNLQVGVFMVEAPSGKPLLANEKAKELLGRGILPDANKYNLAEVYKAFKADSRQPYPPEEMPILLGINGQAAHIEDMLVVRPDGTEILLEISGTPVKDKNGNVWASLVSFMDISERKRAEAEIKAKNEELLKINAEKDKFFSIIAHDLRSPFNAFLGLTRMMEEELPSLTLEEIQSFAVSMRKSATMLFHLLENLLEWSRMQRGLISYKPETFFLSTEIATAIELVRDAADKKMIAISQDIPGNLVVKADAQMFESIMRNLVFNAIKFTAKNGKITLAAKKISDTMVQISVSDTGIGMPRQLISKLFRLEEQTHRVGTEGELSTGLGLIICKDLVEKHSGTIWVESKVGEGSTFHFTIPLGNDSEGDSAQNNKVRTDAAINPARKLKILIVEDDEISKLLISTALNPYSREMLFTRTGSETVEIARNNPDIELIMMDLQMPEMDGYEATRQIRQFDKEVIIIAQTAYGLMSDCDKAIEAGCNDYISKPINLDALRKMITKYFEVYIESQG